MKIPFNNKIIRKKANVSDSLVDDTYSKCMKAIKEDNFFEASKEIGKLELLGFSDIDTISGFAFETINDADNVIKYLSKVDENSIFYDMAMKHLARCYEIKGDYFLLDALIKKMNGKWSETHELASRLNCLEHMDVETLNANCDKIKNIKVKSVESLPVDDNTGRDFFHICRILADILVVAGECINRCVLYKKINPKLNINYENDNDLRKPIELYKKCCLILDFSKYIKCIKINTDNSKMTLADCALENYKWEDKITIFKSSNYVNQIIDMTFKLGAPALHKTIPIYECLDNLISRFILIDSHQMIKIIASYYEVFTEECIKGTESAHDYLCAVYYEILVSEDDSFNIQERLKSFLISQDKGSYASILKNAQLKKTMSEKGYYALANAEHVFRLTNRDNNGYRDASYLSLLFFRVLEFEYNNKLVKAFINNIDINQINNITGYKTVGKKIYVDKQYHNYKTDITIINDLALGIIKSIEIGKIRTLLFNICFGNDEYSHYLRTHLESVLTTCGRDAFWKADMMDIIDKKRVNEYRNPGAHTGFVSYHDACYARDYVYNTIPIIEEWFKVQ